MYKKSLLSRIVHLLLQSMGIFENRTYSVIYCTIITMLSSIGILGSVVGFLNSTGAANRIEAATTMLPQFTGVMLFLSVNLCKRNLLRLLTNLKGYGTSHIIEQSNQFMEKKLKLCISTLAIQCVCMAIPSLCVSFAEGEINDKYSYVVPFWFTCGEGGLNEWTRSMCWRLGSRNKLLLANTIQGIILLLSLVFFAAPSALYGIIVGELVVHSRNIKADVDRFNEEKENVMVVTKHNVESLIKFQRHEENNYRCLLELIKYHRFLHNCVLETINTWEPFLTCFYGVFLGNLSAFLFIALKEYSNSTLLIIRVILIMFFGVQTAFLLNFFSQIVSTLNRDIFDEITNLKWYEQSLRFRKIYITVLMITLKPVRITAAGVFQINLNSFLGMIRIAYSILNVLTIRYGG